MQRSRRSRQLSFDDLRPKRKKPGRKATPRSRVLHRPRPAHKYWNPLHVTLRAIKGLPSFRKQTLFRAFDRAFRTTRRTDFQIVEFSVQDDHVHLIVEADDNDALARGMKSFSVRANRLFNSALGRGRGRVWGDRYHRRDLTSARQVRNALVYCINNYRKHFDVRPGPPQIDGCSSAPWFTGWVAVRTRSDGPRPTPEAKTVLLRTAWQKHGLIHVGEAPKPPS